MRDWLPFVLFLVGFLIGYALGYFDRGYKAHPDDGYEHSADEFR